METFNIQGVEIFSVGKWNGDDYTHDDLKDIVKAFEETKGGIPPYVKIGHADKQALLQKEGLPAAGWVERLFIKGDKLCADFESVPKKVYQLIKTKAYRKVSSEIFMNLKLGNKTYKKVLGAVALLGAETPGVYNLSDILSTYSNVNTNETDLRIYQDTAIELKFDNEGKGPPMKTETELKLEVELKAKQDEAAKLAEEKKQFAADLKTKDEELETLKKFKADAEAKALVAEEEAKQARLEKFTTELVSEKLCSQSMKPLIEQLLGPEKKEYSIKIKDEEKKFSKENLFKETLKLSKALSDVNFDESSDDTKNFSKTTSKDDKEMDEEIKKFAKENSMTYGQAAKEVMKKNKK